MHKHEQVKISANNKHKVVKVDSLSYKQYYDIRKDCEFISVHNKNYTFLLLAAITPVRKRHEVITGNELLIIVPRN